MTEIDYGSGELQNNILNFLSLAPCAHAPVISAGSDSLTLQWYHIITLKGKVNSCHDTVDTSQVE